MAQLERKDLSVHITPQAVEGAVDSNPPFKVIRGTSGIVQSSPTYTTSNEVVTDGQAAQSVQDRQESTFTREFDVTKETITLFEDVIHGVQVDNTVSAVITIGSDSAGFVSTGSDFASYSVGDWFMMSGFADTNLNVLFKISVKTDSNNIETEVAPASVEAEGATVTMTSFKTASGTTKTLRTIQNRIFDGAKAGSTNFQTFIDCFASIGSLSVEKSGIVTGSIEYKIPTPLGGSAAISGQTDDAKDTSPVVSAINNISALYENGIDSLCNIQTLSLEFNNNYEGDGGAAGCIDEQFGRGTISVTGSITARTIKATSSDWQDKNKQGTKQAIAIGFTWSDNDDWAILEITQAVITAHTFPEGEVIVSNDMEFTADPDSVTGSTFQIFASF